MAQPPISAIILAGGAGRRMGGQDKGLVKLHDLPLVAHVLARIRPQVDEILISANRNLDDYRALGYAVVKDASDGFQGPLAGVLAGLRAARHEWVLTVPCDTPRLPADLVQQLAAPLLAGHAEIAVASAGGRTHPAIMVCARRLADDLDTYLAAGGRAVHAWQARHRTATVGFTDAAAFVNVNQPEDLSSGAN